MSIETVWKVEQKKMLWSPRLSLSNFHVKLTAKGLFRNLQLLSGCRKNTVVFHAGLDPILNLLSFVRLSVYPSILLLTHLLFSRCREKSLIFDAGLKKILSSLSSLNLSTYPITLKSGDCKRFHPTIPLFPSICFHPYIHPSIYPPIYDSNEALIGL